MTDNDGENDKTRTPAFDPAARARIRSALISYMRSHDIGVPTLLARIAEATDRSPDLIPQKTLQRFLAGTHRTNDAFLIPLHRFAKKLPVPDPAQELGAAIGQFFGTTQTAMESFQRVLKFGGNRLLTTPINGQVDIHLVPPTGPVRFTELVPNLELENEGKATQMHRYEGILVPLDRMYLAVLRHVVTRLPRIHFLTAGDAVSGGKHVYFSDCTHAQLSDRSSLPSDTTHRELRLTPIKPEPGTS